MIALPIRPDSQRPRLPAVTILLALASAIVFLSFAARDRAAVQSAAQYYVNSGLAAVELPRYREYLQQSDKREDVARLAKLERAGGADLARPADVAATLEVLQDDREFERSLHTGKIVMPGDPAFLDWQSSRQRFERMNAAALGPHLTLSNRALEEPWRLLTHLFVHTDGLSWAIGLLLLLLIGPFAEAAAGAPVYLLSFLAGGALGGLASLIVSSRPVQGEWAALAAIAGLLASSIGTQPMAARLVFNRRRIAVPGFAPLLLLAMVEIVRWAMEANPAVDVAADVAGLASGFATVALFKLRQSPKKRELIVPAQAADTRRNKESALARQAQEAATRQDGRRARDLYKELVELEPDRLDHLCSYLNVALLGPDETTLQDAALRLLWLRSKTKPDQLRKAYLQLTQPKVLKVLPIDEHLRLARRLVRVREDAAALRVLDGILIDTHLRQLYGRQLADCLLGIYTGYTRRRLTTLADSIRSRLTTYFEAPDERGGLAPATRAPTTLFTASPRSRLPPRS